MIKPEDVSSDLEDVINGLDGPTGYLDSEDIAAILNAAIKAGIVSPPCWVMRFNGELQQDANGEPTVWPSRGLDSPDGGISYEHWKGQKE